MRRLAMGLMGSLAVYVTGLAQAADPSVVANLTASRVVTQADGKEAMQSADRARPGDVLEYRVDYHNKASASVGNLVATLPVPSEGVEYIPGTDRPAGALASVDGKTFAPIPLMRTIRLPNGRTETKPVPASEYRFLRWSLGALPANARKSVSARMRLTAVASEAPAPSSKSDGNR